MLEVFETLANHVAIVGVVTWIVCSIALWALDEFLPHTDEAWGELYLHSRFWFVLANVLQQAGTSPPAVKRIVKAALGKAPEWIIAAIMRKAGR